MRIYFDTEFTSLDGNVDWDMISAGFVTETGEEWYVEITDFLHEECSEFVLKVVLPLLGKGDKIPERMAGVHFGWRLCNWLTQFGDDIELVSDAVCDWWVVLGYAYQEFKQQPFKVSSTVWRRSEHEPVQIDLLESELRFWHAQANKGMQHHALFDTRRLKLIAERQALLQEDRTYS